MLVIQLMQKYLDSMHTDKPLQIKSAMCTDVKGYIYVEAYKEVHVREATLGLNNLFYRINQVPVNEMTDVMRVRASLGKKPLQRNSWVRVKKKDDYKDDLGQVVALENDGNHAIVRIIPRLHIYLTRDQEDGNRVRPPAKLFNPEEVRAIYDGDVQQRVAGGRKRFLYEGQEFEDGLMMKKYNVRSLRWGEAVVPSLTELERFKAGLGAHADEELLAAVAPSDLAPRAKFAPGDVVKVCEGDLKNIVGIVQSLHSASGAIIVMPTSTELLGSKDLFKKGLSFQPEQLQKWFKMGDHVKVLGAISPSPSS